MTVTDYPCLECEGPTSWFGILGPSKIPVWVLVCGVCGFPNEPEDYAPTARES